MKEDKEGVDKKEENNDNITPPSYLGQKNQLDYNIFSKLIIFLLYC